MEHPLDDSYLKVERALTQVKTLQSEINREVAKRPFQMHLGENRKTKEQMVKIDQFPTWPPEWALSVGEACYNARSALDYIIAQLSSHSKGDRTAFPISTDRDAYLKPGKRSKLNYRDKCMPGVDPRWAAWIDQLQPFNGPFPPARSCLGLLNSLTNRDKHRIRHDCLSWIELPFACITVAQPELVKAIELRMHPDSRITTSIDFVQPRRKGNRPLYALRPKAKPDDTLGGKVVFGRDEVSIQQLGMIIGFVRFIVGSFHPAFDPPAATNKPAV